MFLIPGTTDFISWIKQNRLDTATYYPVVTITDKRSGAVLLPATELDNLGSDRYGTDWNVPQDPSGQGRQICKVITVYEDAAHTAISGIYGSWETDFLIYDIKPLGGVGGGGGGSYIDYNAIRKMIVEEINKIPKTEIDFKELLEEIGEVKTGVKEKIRQVFNLDKKTENLSNLEKELEQTIKEVDSRSLKSEIRINNAIDDFNQKIDAISEKIKSHSDGSLEGIKNLSSEEIQNIRQEIANGAKTIIKVFNEEKIKIEDDLKQKISKKITVSFDEPVSKKDDRASNLLKYVS
jgi:uncharacterized membrane-anchored protein YhcB (DUF1043 family)